jgi:hypothetical protein
LVNTGSKLIHTVIGSGLRHLNPTDFSAEPADALTAPQAILQTKYLILPLLRSSAADFLIPQNHIICQLDLGQDVDLGEFPDSD